MTLVVVVVVVAVVVVVMVVTVAVVAVVVVGWVSVSEQLLNGTSAQYSVPLLVECRNDLY